MLFKSTKQLQISENEVRQFLGVLLLMGIVQMPEF